MNCFSNFYNTVLPRLIFLVFSICKRKWPPSTSVLFDFHPMAAASSNFCLLFVQFLLDTICLRALTVLLLEPKLQGSSSVFMFMRKSAEIVSISIKLD